MPTHGRTLNHGEAFETIMNAPLQEGDVWAMLSGARLLEKKNIASRQNVLNLEMYSVPTT